MAAQRCFYAQAAFELRGVVAYLESRWLPTADPLLLRPVDASLNENKPFGAVDQVYTNLGLLGIAGTAGAFPLIFSQRGQYFG